MSAQSFLMAHASVLPIVIPMIAGGLLVGLHHFTRWQTQRTLALFACLALLATCLFWLTAAATSTAQTWPLAAYRVGNWTAPFGIVLSMDPLGLLMVTLSTLICTLVLLGARTSPAQGPYFSALVLFQCAGVNGAFLTGDLFNLFVFFEVLLIASYGLLLHGGQRNRLSQGVHYITLNLTGSALFLLAASLLYGVTGTLNMADMALKLGTLASHDQGLARTGLLLLMVVFALKAAALPLNLWLPGTYGQAQAQSAAIFVLLTKVGLVSLLRLDATLTGPWAQHFSNIVGPWLVGLGLAGLVFAQIGLLAARSLSTLVGFSVLVSSSLTIASFGLGSTALQQAALAYMIQSTLATCALYLLVPLTEERAGDLKVAMGFFAAAIMVCAVPPSPGFIAKLGVLKAAAALETPAGWWMLGLTLSSGLLGMVAYGRMGSRLFWKPSQAGQIAPPQGSSAQASSSLAVIALCLVLLAATSGFAASAWPWVERAVEVLHQTPRLAGQ
jgi:multicomponent K+:H+ antiporter subunit D